MKIVLLGLPSAGKSTQGKNLSEFYTVLHYSMGDLVRAEFQNKTELSQRISSYWGDSKTWLPLPDAIAIEIAKPICAKNSWIIDGFPRNINQAKVVQEVDFVIYLKISPNIAVLRCQIRARGDELSSAERLLLESDRLPPLLEFWQQKNKLITINGELDQDSVFSEILDAILPF
jgi:adenylate kinase